MLPRQQYILNTLQTCISTCAETSSLVLQQSNANLLLRVSKLSRDCADLCQLTAAFVARESEHLVYVLRECAELCRTCADEQARHAATIAACKRAEDACRRAEDACRTAYH